MTPMTVGGWGRAHPDTALTNADLEKILDTSDQWIRERTGITSRFVGGTSDALSIDAARKAMDRAGTGPDEIDVVIVATSTSEERIPGASASIADALGLRCGAFDLNGACAGFGYGLVTASGWMDAGVQTVLLVGADAMSAITDPTDRGTAILFGDAAGALVLRAGGTGGLVAWDAGTDGSLRTILHCPRDGLIDMQGQAVFKIAVRVAVESALATLERADMKPGDIDLFIPHQANQRITDAIASRLEIGPERVVSTLADTGNSSAGSIPYSMSVAADEGRLHDGSVVLTSGFGAGMTWATSIFRWTT
jgi:3-oxoacyl-[acyl-carrier-protein] synthase-3